MPKISNRMWFLFHGWCSLPIWLLFCFVCLTGTVAVLSHEITWLTNPAARALNPDALPEKSVAELVENVQRAYPDADVSNVMLFEPYLVNAVVFSDVDKPFAIAYVNQYSGEIQEVNSGITFIGFMRSLHGWLLFPWQNGFSVGYYLVSGLSLLMLGSVISGMVIYKRFWRSFFSPKLRFNQGKRTLVTDLHRLLGVWSIWFIVLMSLTGLWYLAQGIMWHADVDIEPHTPLVDIADVPMGEARPQPSLSLKQALLQAKEQFPDFHPSYISLPEHNRDLYRLQGSGDFLFYDQYAYGLELDPWSGVIVSSKSPQTMTTLQTMMHIADPLHYGTLAGVWTKTIWFLFGLLLSGISITGFMIWSSRIFKASRRQQEVPLVAEQQESY